MASSLVGACAAISETPGDGGSKADGTHLDVVTIDVPNAEKIVSDPKLCGNKTVDNGEDCDDGNTDSGDGCSSLCQREPGYTCNNPGQLCDPPRCGDGSLSDNESCDDGNTSGGDGCSSDCKTIESGFICRVPGKHCTPICGDGLLAGTETCDDGNTDSGDGCSSSCLLEPGATCDNSKPNKCKPAVCGNGMVEAGESCDAGSLNGLFYGDGSGCSKTCTKEPKCRDGSGTVTTRACDTSCGNGNVETGEDCDDGNTADNDGCSHDCKIEGGSFSCSDQMLPDTVDCTQSANSGKQCLELPIIYRDFKNESVSGGHPDFFYLGATIPNPVMISGVQGQTGSIPYSKRYCVSNSGGPAKKNDSVNRCWDLATPNLDPQGKPLFNSARPNGTNCDCQFIDWSHDGNGGHVPGALAANSPTYGMPTYVDGASGHPMYRGLAPIVSSKDTFAQWFRDTMYNPGSTHAVGNLEMAATGTANQYQFSSQPNSVTGGFFPLDPMANMFPLYGTAPAGPGTVKTMPAPWSEALLCNLWPYWNTGSTSFGAANGCKGDQYLFPPSTTTAGGAWTTGMQGWYHDAWYSTEARYLFNFTDQFSLQFYGDDDMFIYINGIQVLDLGGVHQRLPGRVDVSATGMATIVEGGSLDAAGMNILPCPSADPYTMLTTNSMTNVDGNGHSNCTIANCDCRNRSVDLKLSKGSTYEIAVFSTDRHPTESNYQLTLSGFATKRTVCMPVCGDGVISGSEECDDGANNQDNAYGACTKDCKYGPYCGDGNTDSPNEACDDGAKNGASYSTSPTSGCTFTCQKPHFCGDGMLDPQEECDLGDQNGKSGSVCGADCKKIIG
ncbi:MAG TPA: DUF4215 domain-containing protein [Polyangia bacterium]